MDVLDGILMHGCNTQGVMGAGVAKQIKANYPEAFNKYINDLNNGMRSGCLGYNSWWRDKGRPNFWIVSALTQEFYGTDKRYVSYDAIAKSFSSLNRELTQLGIDHKTTQINIPKIGAGLAGGNWKIISTIIEETCPELNITCWSL